MGSAFVCVFETSTMLEATPEALFAFHADPRNLTVVMPPTMRLVKVVADEAAMAGGRIEVLCRDWWFIPIHFVSRWKVVRPPELLVDEMMEGPFRLFVHEHEFTRISSEQTQLRDRICYAWGRSWWGRLVSETFVRAYLTLLFAYRHQRTRRWALRQG